MLPRLMWVKKDWTLQQLHIEVFRFLKYVFVMWLDFNNPNFEKSKENP